MARNIVIDNSRPSDSSYPTFKPAKLSDTLLIVKVGQYVVDRDGDIMLVTSANRKVYPNKFLESINQPYFRAKYLGNKDDLLAFANQCRLATKAEIAKAKGYKRTGFKVEAGGQLALV
jgi:hypothetical protein